MKAEEACAALGPETVEKLIRTAAQMRSRSYVPYSRFAVGAALLTEDGTVYGGCNIANAAYTPTNCAERTAFFTAVAAGERHFRAIAIAGGPQGAEKLDFCPPCGVCRQVMMEFCDPESFLIITARSTEEYRVHTLREYLPDGFGPADLAQHAAWV